MQPIRAAKVGPARLEIVVADITTLDDAIVNPANETLLGAAASMAPSIAPPGRNCWSNAARSAAARRDQERSPAAIV
jgi:hypothetical protein